MIEHVDKLIVRGRAPDSLADLKTLSESTGMKTVICLQSWAIFKIARERRWCKSLGLNFIHIPMSILHPARAWKMMTAAALVIEQRQSGQTVYVHCHDGVDRTGMVIALFRMLCGWSYQSARDEMFRAGFHYWRYFWWPPFLKYFFWRNRP